MARTTSIYLSDELDRDVRASGKSLPDLVRLGLEHERQRDRLAGAVESLLRQLAEQGYQILAPSDPRLERGTP